MPKCRNPECDKEVEEGKNYCNQDCLKRHLEIKAEAKKHPIQIDPTIEAVLGYMGIEKENFTKDVAYRHWARFIQFIKDNSGKSWDNFLKPRLRSYIGIDYRYLDDFLESCLSWGTVELRNGNAVFIGIPEGDRQ